MQNFITFVNEHLSWEEDSPHRHDCHEPPPLAHMGFHDDISPPRRLAAVARSGPWKATPAKVGFPADAPRRRRLSWVVGFHGWNNSRGKDCHPSEEFCALSRDSWRSAIDFGLRKLPIAGFKLNLYVKHVRVAGVEALILRRHSPIANQSLALRFINTLIALQFYQEQVRRIRGLDVDCNPWFAPKSGTCSQRFVSVCLPFKHRYR